jgi:predicted small lipoprotein YifL
MNEDQTRRTALLALLALALAACGRKGDPLPPAGADPAYPRQYPSR